MKEYHTVIASSEKAYWEIKDRLWRIYKLSEFEHFTYYEIYHKKTAIIYGNCHTGPVKEMLRRTGRFSKLYGFYPLPQIQEIRQSGSIEAYLSGAAGKCDLFLHQCIRKDNTYGESFSSDSVAAILKLSMSDCPEIGIPNLYRMPQFMFTQLKYGEKTHENRYGFQFEDTFINEQYKNLSISEISSQIENNFSLFNKRDIIENYESFLCKVGKREKEWDIKVLDFIQNRLRTSQLFYDPNHPTNVLLEYIASEVLKAMKIAEKPSALSSAVCELDSFEIPIYGAVKNALGMTFSQNELRKTGFRLNYSAMTTEEYVRQYCCWHNLKYKE